MRRHIGVRGPPPWERVSSSPRRRRRLGDLTGPGGPAPRVGPVRRAGEWVPRAQPSVGRRGGARSGVRGGGRGGRYQWLAWAGVSLRWTRASGRGGTTMSTLWRATRPRPCRRPVVVGGMIYARIANCDLALALHVLSMNLTHNNLLEELRCVLLVLSDERYTRPVFIREASQEFPAKSQALLVLGGPTCIIFSGIHHTVEPQEEYAYAADVSSPEN